MTTTRRHLLAHDVIGDGPALVLIHPAGLDRHVWDFCRAGLARHFTVVSVDRRHHGDNIAPAGRALGGATTVPEFLAWLDGRRAEDSGESEDEELARLLSTIGLPGASPIGIGDGGQIALALAARASAPSSSVRSAVTLDAVVPGVGGEPGRVVDALGGGRLEGLADIVSAVLADGDAAPFVEWILDQDDYARATAEARRVLRVMLRRNAFSGLLAAPTPGGSDLGSRISSVEARVLLLRTGHPDPTVAALDRALGQLLPHARIETLPSATSHLPLDAPAAFTKRIVEHAV